MGLSCCGLMRSSECRPSEGAGEESAALYQHDELIVVKTKLGDKAREAFWIEVAVAVMTTQRRVS
jgi:hypothetical protein